MHSLEEAEGGEVEKGIYRKRINKNRMLGLVWFRFDSGYELCQEMLEFDVEAQMEIIFSNFKVKLSLPTFICINSTINISYFKFGRKPTRRRHHIEQDRTADLPDYTHLSHLGEQEEKQAKSLDYKVGHQWYEDHFLMIVWSEEQNPIINISHYEVDQESRDLRLLRVDKIDTFLTECYQDYHILPQNHWIIHGSRLYAQNWSITEKMTQSREYYELQKIDISITKIFSCKTIKNYILIAGEARDPFLSLFKIVESVGIVKMRKLFEFNNFYFFKRVFDVSPEMRYLMIGDNLNLKREQESRKPIYQTEEEYCISERFLIEYSSNLST